MPCCTAALCVCATYTVHTLSVLCRGLRVRSASHSAANVALILSVVCPFLAIALYDDNVCCCLKARQLQPDCVCRSRTLWSWWFWCLRQRAYDAIHECGYGLRVSTYVCIIQAGQLCVWTSGFYIAQTVRAAHNNMPLDVVLHTAVQQVGVC
jgi:hypothetical protein